MAEKIYKLFMGKPKAAWLKLTDEERQAILEKLAENARVLGVKVIINCDSSWANEECSFWGVNEYDSFETLKKHVKMLAELNIPYEFLETKSILGTEVK